MPIADRLRRFFSGLITGLTDRLQAINGRPARTVPEENVQDYVARYLPVFKQEVERHTDKLISGEFIERQWKFEVREELRSLYLTAAAAAAGGIGRLTQADIADIDRKLREQEPYLERFTQTIMRTPREERSRESILNRLSLYGGTAKPITSRILARSQGRPTLPFDPGHGSLCLNHCKCHWRWVDVNPTNGDWDVFWVVTVAVEHCQTCIDRQKACNPLRIRGGRIVSDLDLKVLIVKR